MIIRRYSPPKLRDKNTNSFAGIDAKEIWKHNNEGFMNCIAYLRRILHSPVGPSLDFAWRRNVERAGSMSRASRAATMAISRGFSSTSTTFAEACLPYIRNGHIYALTETSQIIWNMKESLRHATYTASLLQLRGYDDPPKALLASISLHLSAMLPAQCPNPFLYFHFYVSVLDVQSYR